ncbi:MAG TPA: lysylphosphatidylglycerol synthase transmembrane domain-containing protein [Candidatus Dormibacteraeota bacterium]|nr:lysylphosphatidylglycerol synthase transmembrane domain-containing protein [Candidatus Dormibacteraeota bacterium]
MKVPANARHFPSLRRLLPALISLAILGLIVEYVHPDELGTALARFHLAYLPVVLFLSLAYYLIKGYQWHLFLKPLQLDHGAVETILIYFAGQPTAILPLGELSRAFILRQHAKVNLGEVSATVVVQELLYPIGLIAAAVPGAGRFPGAQAAVVVALLGILGISTILLWPRAFTLVMRVAVRIPYVRHYSVDLRSLHKDVIFIARRPATLGPALLGPIAAVIAIAMFYFTVRSVGVELGVYQAAFVYAVAHLAGGVSLLPGGIGAYEGTMTVLLVAFGLAIPVAAAVAILNRAFDRLLVTVVGTVVYFAIRRPLNLRGITLLPDQ